MEIYWHLFTDRIIWIFYGVAIYAIFSVLFPLRKGKEHEVRSTLVFLAGLVYVIYLGTQWGILSAIYWTLGTLISLLTSLIVGGILCYEPLKNVIQSKVTGYERVAVLDDISDRVTGYEDVPIFEQRFKDKILNSLANIITVLITGICGLLTFSGILFLFMRTAIKIAT